MGNDILGIYICLGSLPIIYIWLKKKNLHFLNKTKQQFKYMEFVLSAKQDIRYFNAVFSVVFHFVR